MLINQWSIVCKECIVDQASNMVSIIGVLEGITSDIVVDKSKFKDGSSIVVPFNHVLVCYWRSIKNARVGAFDVKVTITDSKNKEVAKAVRQFVFPEDKKNLRTIMNLNGLPATTSGGYVYRVYFKEAADKDFKLASEIPLEVTLNIKKQDTITSSAN